jgi:hypothetical protein
MNPGYSEHAGLVTLTMTRADYECLLMICGAGASTRIGDLSADLALVDRLNAGNPNWTPYTDKGRRRR